MDRISNKPRGLYGPPVLYQFQTSRFLGTECGQEFLILSFVDNQIYVLLVVHSVYGHYPPKKILLV